jgi:hypothetical protein
MNVAAMVRWHRRLRELPRYADNHPVHLILDAFSARRCQEVGDVARSLHIVMHFIPAGATDTMQPRRSSRVRGYEGKLQANLSFQSGRS